MDLGGTTDGESLSAAPDDPPSRAVIEAVAAADGAKPDELPPLYAVVDPDALDAMFRGRPDGSITFEYNGYTVTVHGTAEVTVH